MLKLKEIKAWRPFYSTVGLLVFTFIAAIFIPEFRTPTNFVTILRQSCVLLVLATGLTAVLLTGGIDLSVPKTAGLIGCICARFLKMGVPTWSVILIAIAMGVIIGLSSGLLVSIVRLPSFVATYALNWVVSGLAMIVMSGAVIYDLPSNFTVLGTGYIGPIPVIVIVTLIIVLLVWFILQKTTIGRDIFMYGNGPTAAKYAGVSLPKTIISAFILSSVCAGLAGVLMTARLNAADAAMGDAYVLEPIAAIVIGGTSMLGGEGGVTGTIIGAILLTIIVNVMNLLGITSFAQPLVVGIVILTIVFFDSFLKVKKN
ncbi:MAG: ABC transporter permease [Pleomorphochaeta sp.]|jgi:ribose transport system permease protein